MSQIDDLIRQHSPDGVQTRPIGEIGVLVRGNGIQKSDFVDEGVGCIHYGQIHTHYGTWATETKSFVSAQLAAKTRQADPGNLVIATTSEDDEAVGKAVAWLGSESVAVSTDAFILRHSMDPKFVAYFFQTEQFQAQKRRHVTGTKVRRISGEVLAKINIPVPPLEVQREIVRVLDLFQSLEAELEAELEARRRQYAHYRDSLLDFTERGGVRWMTLGEVAVIGTGSRNTVDAEADGEYPFFVRSQEPLSLNQFDFEESAVITAGDGVGVGKIFHFVEGRYALHQRAYRVVPNIPDLRPEFLFRYIQSDFGRYLEQTSVHSSVTSLRRPMFEKYPIPLPTLEEQDRVISVLRKFDALVNDISVGLPAELAARRSQYEYYRDRLLTFEDAA